MAARKKDIIPEDSKVTSNEQNKEQAAVASDVQVEEQTAVISDAQDEEQASVTSDAQVEEQAVHYEITAPSGATKKIAGLDFVNGMAKCHDSYTASWFANKGYKVIKVPIWL